MAKFVHGERGQTVGERYRDIRIAVHRNNNHDLEAKMVDELLDQNDQNKYWLLSRTIEAYEMPWTASYLSSAYGPT